MDDFHKREKDIYMMINQTSPESKPTGIDARAFFGFNHNDYPEIEASTTIQKYPEESMKFIHRENIFSPEGIVVDSSFFKIFDFELKTGNKETILSDINTVIITETLAKKIFGNENPVGKKLKIASTFEDTYTVNGIIEKLPPNSSLSFDFILPYDDEPNKYARSGGVFLLARNNFNKNVFNEKIKDIGHKHQQFKESITRVIPFNSLYFNHGTFDDRGIISRFGDKKVIHILLAIMLVILVISALNFSNLQIINTNETLKQLAISVVNGAKKKQLLNQKVCEIILLLFLSVLIITIGYQLVLPTFNSFVNIEIAPPFNKILVVNTVILSTLIGLSIVYPSIVIIRRPLMKSLKPLSFSGNQLVGRKAIAVFQFALTFVLLISSVIVAKQLNMMLNQDLGFKHKNIISTKLFSRVPFPPNGKNFTKDKWDNYETTKAKQRENYQFAKNELASHTAIINFSQGYSPLNPFKTPWKLKNSDNQYTSENLLSINFNYHKLFDLKLVEGRFFDTNVDQSRNQKLVINEAAKRLWNINDISKNFLLNKYWDDKNGFEIIGVVKDFNYEHLSTKPKPLLMTFWDDIEEDFLIQFREDRVQEGLEFVEALFNKVNPGETFSYSFLNDEIAALYEKEKRLSTIYIVFTIIALLISAIGLFTIALYDTQRRIKEIGIRKVNGATINEIMLMLNKDFIKWVVIAFVIACPIAYYAMSKWLENFAYKTELSWWVFALAGVFTLVIALLTVSWQTYRAATRNPVESLRDE
jgi:putative ABC transport system permease protein